MINRMNKRRCCNYFCVKTKRSLRPWDSQFCRMLQSWRLSDSTTEESACLLYVSKSLKTRNAMRWLLQGLEETGSYSTARAVLSVSTTSQRCQYRLVLAHSLWTSVESRWHRLSYPSQPGNYRNTPRNIIIIIFIIITGMPRGRSVTVSTQCFLRACSIQSVPVRRVQSKATKIPWNCAYCIHCCWHLTTDTDMQNRPFCVQLTVKCVNTKFQTN